MNGFIHEIQLQTDEHNFMTIHNDGCKNALVATSIPVEKKKHMKTDTKK